MDYTEIDLVIANTPGYYLKAGYFSELKANLQDLAGEKFTTTFNGTTGTVITFANPDSKTARAIITPNADPVGRYWIVFDSSTQATLYNSETAADGGVTVIITLE